MLVLGLILVLLSAGALVAVLASGTNDTAVMYGGSVHLPTLVVFLAGAAALLLFVIGLELLRSGVKRANQNRQNNKRLRKLERREELRRQAQAEGTEADAGAATAETVPPTDTSESAPPPHPEPDETAVPATRTDTTPTIENGTSGPYQAPPPPSR
jgi:hypothetical protein